MQLQSMKKSPSREKSPSMKKSPSREKKSKMQISPRTESLNNQYTELYHKYILEGNSPIIAHKKAFKETESRQRMMEMADEINAQEKEIRDRETPAERELRIQKENTRKKSPSRKKKSSMDFSRAQSLYNTYTVLYNKYISEGKSRTIASEKAHRETESRQRMMEMADVIDAKEKKIRDLETPAERQLRLQKEHEGNQRTMEAFERRKLANAMKALNNLHL